MLPWGACAPAFWLIRRYLMTTESVTESQVREGCLIRLQHATQTLALPAEAQLALFPDFVCKADELALDFDNWWRCIKARQEEMLSTDQVRLLQKIDTQLSQMSGMENADLWTEGALHDNPAWQEIRDLAK